MIRYEIENDIYVVHVDTDRWTADIRRRYLKECKAKAAENNWPTVFCQVTPDKKRFMEHLGLTFVRSRLTTDLGLVLIYSLKTEVFKNVRD